MWIIFKVAHILTLLLGVGASLGPEILMYRVARSADVRAIRTCFGLAAPLLKAAPALFMLGLSTGLTTVWAGGFSFTAPWLLISYALFVLMIFFNLRFRAPWVKKVLRLANASADTPSEPLLVALRDRRARVHMWSAPFALLAQVVLMVVKPFS